MASRAPRKRNYTEEDRATALAFLTANGGNVQRTAKAVGIPRSTIQYWAEGGTVNAAVTNLRQEKEADLTALWEQEARVALETAGQIRYEASYGQLVMAAGIATDKAIALKRADAVTPEQIETVIAGFEAAVQAHVPDADARTKISAELERLAQAIRRPA